MSLLLQHHAQGEVGEEDPDGESQSPQLSQKTHYRCIKKLRDGMGISSKLPPPL